jgi:DNA (cytosine-5)-methyltransferase 1
MNGFDLFAGAGGLSEGFIQAGFNIIGSVEKEKWACETQKTRHIYHYLRETKRLKYYWDYCRSTLSPEEIIDKREKIYKKNNDLSELIDQTIWKAEFGNPLDDGDTMSSRGIIDLLEESANFHKKNVDFILGGPPCQAYSLVGRSRMGKQVRNDKRNYLFKYYYNVVKHFKPAFFLFENVPGIVSANDGAIFKMIKEDFNEIGYEFKAGPHENIHLNIQVASNYGVPQSRKRFIFIGFRKDLQIKYPECNPIEYKKELTTRNAIGDLPLLCAGEGNDHGVFDYQKLNDLSGYQEKMKIDAEGVMNHRARPLNKWYDRKIYTIAIIKAEKGEKIHYSELPPNLKTHKNETNFQDRFRVHAWDEMPHTIVAHISKDGHYNIHPDINQLRALTVREAARIQSFPDNFKFEGSRSSQYEQVGNAVPPLMAEKIAYRIKEMLN